MSFQKIIKSSNIKTETSYANSALQGFLHLDCIKNWINYLKNSGEINNIFYSKALTKDLYLLYCDLISETNIDLDSSQLLMDFESNIQNIFHKNITKDPYHFIYYFLELLHYENNFPAETNFNFNNYNKKLRENISNDINMFNIFNDFFNKTHNSIISKNFYNIQKYAANCPACKSLYNYGFKKIIRFNLDELIFLRNKIYPLKAQNLISLSECFRCSSKMKPINCTMCHQGVAYILQQVYDTSNILIIAFNRFNNKNNFKNDVKFYLKFDISELIINKNSKNTKYKLKAIISCYSNGKYCSFVSINNTFYQFMNCPGMKEVKLINDANELMTYEPHLLIYELDNQNGNINNYSSIETIMVLKSINSSNLEQTIKMNYNLSNNTPQMSLNNSIKSNNSSETSNNLWLKFLVIPLNWDGSEQNTIPINFQATYDFTVQEAINNFFIKLTKPKEAINNFIFNNNPLNVNSTQKLSDMNFNQNSVIYAIKSPNFDSL